MRDKQKVLAAKNVQTFIEFLRRQGYSVNALDRYGLVYEVKHGSFLKFLCSTDFNTAECSKLMRDKVFTYCALENLGINVPKGEYFVLGQHRYAVSTGEIVSHLRDATYPLVLKPNDSCAAKGVTILNRFDEMKVTNAIFEARKYSGVLIAQEYLTGQEYRVVAVEGEISMILQRFSKPENPKEIQTPRPDFVHIVSISMKYLGAKLCGFDFLVQGNRTVVLEVNSNPAISQFREHVAAPALEQYLIKLERLLRRENGH
jgi:glutathione synthase/RimK-type ligase-like ATP-grasp enzyme